MKYFWHILSGILIVAVIVLIVYIHNCLSGVESNFIPPTDTKGEIVEIDGHEFTVKVLSSNG